MRKCFIDNLRWMDVLLLIPYRAAQAFNTWGEPYFVFFEPNKAISSLIVFFSPFFMPLLFLLAGMSTRYALGKRTYKQYIAERVKRLLIPFVFGTLAFCPVLSYIGDITNSGYEGSFASHYEIFFTRWTDLSGFDGGFGVGQFWFLYFLFIISLVSVGVIAAVNKISGGRSTGKSVPFPVICLFVIPLPFLYDLLSIGGKSFAEYTYVFLIGYFIMADDRVIAKAAEYKFLTMAAGLAASILNVYMFIWSGRDFGVLNTAAKAFSEWFMILALIGAGKSFLDYSNKVSSYMSQRSFPYFSIHFLWTVLFQYLLADALRGSLILLYFVPVISALAATFICAGICIRVPFLCFLTGTKRRQIKP